MIKILNYFRVAAIIPKTLPCQINNNLHEIKKSFFSYKILEENVDLVVFPIDVLTGHTCGDVILKKFRDIERQLEKATYELKNAFYNHGLNNFPNVLMGYPIVKDNKVLSGAIYFNSDKKETTIISPDSHPIINCRGEEILININGNNLLDHYNSRLIVDLNSYSDIDYKHYSDFSRVISKQKNCGFLSISCNQLESGCSEIYSGDMEAFECGEKIAHVSDRNITDSILDQKRYLLIDFDLDTISGKRGSMLDEESHVYTCDKFSDKMTKTRLYNTDLFNSAANNLVFRRQSLGLQRRILALGGCKTIIGISGGSDSTLALLVAVDAYSKLGMDLKNIIGVTMPCFGTTDRTKNNAKELMKLLNIDSREIPIDKTVTQHLNDIGHPLDVPDIAFENAQARIRTQTLFDIANMEGNCIVLGTGDFSEACLGWCTYGGDQFSSYNVNAMIPKTQVKEILRLYKDFTTLVTPDMDIWENDKLLKIIGDIIETPVSPELLLAKNNNIEQLSEDKVGPYELIDYFIHAIFIDSWSIEKIVYLAKIAFKDKYEEDEIKKWLKNFIIKLGTQQFKRTCTPDSPRVNEIEPWKFPSDISLKELADLCN